MKNVGLRVVIGIIVVIAVIAMNYSDESIIQYNDATVDILERNDSQYQGVLGIMDEWYTGAQIDITMLRKELAQLKSVHESCLAEIKAIEVPDSTTCQNYQNAVVKYMSMDAGIIGAYMEAADYVEAHNPGVEADYDAVGEMVNPLVEKQDLVFNEITATQGAMASDHGFELE